MRLDTRILQRFDTLIVFSLCVFNRLADSFRNALYVRVKRILHAVKPLGKRRLIRLNCLIRFRIELFKRLLFAHSRLFCRRVEKSVALFI